MSLPTRATFPFLSRLDPNSYVVEDRVWYPQVRKSVYLPDEQVTLVLNGAPNEMLLSEKVELALNARQILSTDGTAPLAPYGSNDPALNQMAGFLWGNSVTQYSRESYNASSLPLLENSDRSLHLNYNTLRALFCRSSADVPKKSTDKHGEIVNADKRFVEIYDLQMAGFRSLARKLNEITIIDNKVSPNALVINTQKCKSDYSIPLGFYSDLVNCNSIIPLGLLASYNSNGMAVQIELANGKKNMTMANAAGKVTVIPTASTQVPNGGVTYNNVQVNGKIVKFLDPMAMEKVYSLYQKTATASVGEVEFPLALRLNTIGHRFYQFPVTSGVSDYQFHIPTNDKSVRAIAWQVIKNDWKPSATGNNTVDPVSCGTLFVDEIDITRVKVDIGSLKVMCDAVETTDPRDGTVNAWAYSQVKKSAHLFSPKPYWYERESHNNNQEDFWFNYGNDTNRDATGTPHRVLYGAFNLENAEHAEFDTKDISSGVDVSQYGAIDVHMRFKKVAQSGVSDVYAESSYGNIDANYTILFCLAYDQVMEISPQGVANVSQSVL